MDTANIITHGPEQTIQLPKDYRFEGTKVYLKRVGNAVMLIPECDSWDVALDSLKDFTADFMADRNQSPLTC